MYAIENTDAWRDQARVSCRISRHERPDIRQTLEGGIHPARGFSPADYPSTSNAALGAAKYLILASKVTKVASCRRANANK